MVFGPFHRLESPTQTVSDARMQVRTGRVCGRIARGGLLPSVKAYTGPIPLGERGIEFETDVAPLSGVVPHLAIWRQGMPGVADRGNDLVCIPVTILKNSQVT